MNLRTVIWEIFLAYMDCLVGREGKHSPTRPPVITSLWWQQTVLDLLHPNYIPHLVYSKPTRSQGCVRTSFNHNSQQIQTILQSKFHQWRGSLSTVMSRQPALASARFEIHTTVCYNLLLCHFWDEPSTSSFTNSHSEPTAGMNKSGRKLQKAI